LSVLLVQKVTLIYINKMITPQQLLSNKVKMKSTTEKYGIFTDELSQFLGEEFYSSPASVSLDMYGCYPGGLVDHILKICKYAILVNEKLPEFMKSKDEQILKICILSQIGKTYLYKPNNNEWQRKVGKMYEYNNKENIALRCGERSVFYCLSNGVKLTEEEYQIILDIDKEQSDKLLKYSTNPLYHILKIGFDLAVLEEKNKE
jgi:hypothetical protein